MKTNLFDFIHLLTSTDKKTLSQKALKTVEEVGELAKYVLPYDDAYATTHRFVERQRILEESVDTVLSALSVAYDVGFTTDEIEEMMWTKSHKWHYLQTKQDKVKYPTPFEIHITVSCNGPLTLDFSTAFNASCERIGVKPIVLDLTLSNGNSIVDVMTSSKHVGNNMTVYREVERIVTLLTNDGFTVTRKKIETVPWHPAAPQQHGEPMPNNCYFEAHLPIMINNKSSADIIAQHCKDLGAHMSRNAFKTYPDGSYVQMVTMRKYDGTYESFKREVDLAVTMFEANGLINKPIIEFSIYDTKLSNDFPWIPSTKANTNERKTLHV